MNRRVLIVGCGSIGQTRAMYAGQYLDAIDDLWLYDENDASAEMCAVATRPHFANVAAWHDLDNLHEVDPPTHIVLCTPPDVRSSVMRDLPYDVNTRWLIEKPLALSLAEVEKIKAVNQTNIEVACNMRYHPEVLRIIGWAGMTPPTGARLWMHQEYTKAYHDRECGVIMDSIHELDLARVLLGPITGIAGFPGPPYPLGDGNDSTRATYIVEHRGRCSEISLSMTSPRSDRGIELFYPDMPPYRTERAAMLHWPNIWSMYAMEMQRFLSNVRGQTLDGATEVLRWALKLVHPEG